MIKVLIPELSGNIAPNFEVSTHFIVAELSDKKVFSQETVTCLGTKGYHRVRLLKIHDIDILVCNGIEGFYHDLILNMGVKVIIGISLPIKETLAKALSGDLVPRTHFDTGGARSPEVPLKELIDWTVSLFEGHGYQVNPGPGQDSFLIDLVAEIDCPVCHKAVRVAICCGVHTYRTEKELREFHYCAKNYNARAFIYPDVPGVEDCCREYGIEFIQYGEIEKVRARAGMEIIPLLKSPIIGHEKASVVKDQ